MSRGSGLSNRGASPMPPPKDSDSLMNSIPPEAGASLDTIRYQLRELCSDVKSMMVDIRVVSERHTEFLVWKEKIEGRLGVGQGIMTEQERQIRNCREEFEKHTDELRRRFTEQFRKLEEAVKKEIESLNKEIPQPIEKKLDERYIRREMVKWIVFGFALSGAAGGAFGKMLFDLVSKMGH